MSEKKQENRLIPALREGVGLIQMLLYKELKERFIADNPMQDQLESALLAGAVTGEVFAAANPEEKFVRFRKEHFAEIEQKLLGLRHNHTELVPFISDALRIQVLCDYHENLESSSILKQAQSYGYLDEDREIPLPSAFMTAIRQLGKKHNLIIPPVEISREEEDRLLQ